MHSHLLSILLMVAFFSIPFQVECSSYFGMGNRQLGDQLLLRDELENRHTGLTEVPTIAFNYVIREPITSIEIMSDQNVQADVNFSYYNALINGTVTALSTLLRDGKKPFKVLISIYGFNEGMPELNSAEQLRQQLYYGPLVPNLEPGEEDHMEIFNTSDNVEEVDILNESSEEPISDKNYDEFEAIENENDVQDEDKDEDEFDDDDDENESDTFESMDKIMTVGDRQRGDELIYETYQTSQAATEQPTNHNVTFYFIDDVNITHIQFVLIDYFNNKSAEDISKLKLIEYSHFTSSTFKAFIRDYKTTSLFAKMSVYGYRPENLPIHYVSYIPEKVRSITEAAITTESPEMYLRAQINALQRDDFRKLPNSFDMLRREGEFQYTITNAGENSPSSNNVAATNSLQSKITNLSVMMALGFVIVVNSLRTLVASFD